MKVIGVFGKKGGSGKTLVSHFLAHGMASGLGLETVLLQTDVRTERPTDLVEGREYLISAMRNENPDKDWAFLIKTYQKLMDRPDNTVLIIDGGANRSSLDLKLSPLCDLVLIPTQFSAEDIKVADADFFAIYQAIRETQMKAVQSGQPVLKETNVLMLRNRWPGTTAKYDAVMQKSWIKDFIMRTEALGVLFPKYIPDMQSLTDIAVADDPSYTPRIHGQARAFAEIIAGMLEIPYVRQPMGPLATPLTAANSSAEQAA